MTDLEWLMLANACLWLGFGLYIASLAQVQKKLMLRLKRMEAQHD